MQLLGEASGLLAFFFISDDALKYDPEAIPKADADPVLEAAIDALEPLFDWRHETIEAALRVALIDGLELKPRLAFGPLRAAISGRRISPPLFESMELLGQESTLARLAKLRTLL
jgi:glutamyl-tRNA synthetase